jgi:glycosyltransferase involved in cell wall biosynthesis
VTTSNGGSADYAVDGETALVCGRDPDEMADAMERLVRDEPLRIRIATNGARFVERFRWETSADRLIQVASERASMTMPSTPVERVDLQQVLDSLRAGQ